MVQVLKEKQDKPETGFSFRTGTFRDGRSLISAIESRGIEIHHIAKARMMDHGFLVSQPGQEISVERSTPKLIGFKSGTMSSFNAGREKFIGRGHRMQPDNWGPEAAGSGYPSLPGSQTIFMAEGERVFMLDHEESGKKTLWSLSAKEQSCNGGCTLAIPKSKSS